MVGAGRRLRNPGAGVSEYRCGTMVELGSRSAGAINKIAAVVDVRFAELECGECEAGHAQHREVGFRIAADDLGRELIADGTWMR